MKKKIFFPILMTCPFLLAAAPSNSSISDAKPALCLDLEVNLIEENIDENKRIFLFTFKNNERYPALLENSINLDGDDNGVLDAPIIYDQDFLLLGKTILHPNHQASFKIETTLEFDYPSSYRYPSRFLTEIAKEMTYEDLNIIPVSNRINEFTLEGTFSGMEPRRYDYEAILDITYDGNPESFCVDMKDRRIAYYGSSPLELNKLEIEKITFYKEINQAGRLNETLGFFLVLLVVLTILFFAFVISLILGVIGLIIAGIVIACVVVTKKKKQN